jgi:integrase
MTLSSHVLRRGGVYWFRIRVPKRLRTVLGRRELWRSLRTLSPAEARRRAMHLAALTASLWCGADAAMSPDEAKALVDQWLRAKLDEDAELRDLPEGRRHFIAIFRKTEPWRPDEYVRTVDPDQFRDIVARDPMTRTLYKHPEEESAKDVTDAEIARRAFFKPLEEAPTRLALDDDAVARPLVRELLSEAGVTADEASPGFRAALRFMMRAQRDLLLAHIDRNEAGWRRWASDDPADHLAQRIMRRPAVPADQVPISPPATAQIEAIEPVAHLLEDAAEAYIAESLKAGAFKPSRANEVRAAVRTFNGWFGRQAHLSEVTIQIAGEYRRHMAFYPESGSKRPEYRSLSVAERIRKSRACNEARVISRVTLNGKYIDPLRGLWTWAASSGMVTQNPFDDIRVKLPKGGERPRRERADFTPDQLKTLFSSTVFTGSLGDEGRPLYQPGHHRVDDWRYWLPLMALYTGARLNELCALQLADFGVRDGIDFIHIRAATEGQSTKTKAADRLVPIHPHLVELGLVTRVTALKASGEERLFPRLSPGPRGFFSDHPSKFFQKLIPRMLGKGQKVVFHSFRHTFISALRRADVPREVRTALVGHEDDDSIRNETHEGYGEEAFNRLAKAVQAVCWPGLELDALRLPIPPA